LLTEEEVRNFNLWKRGRRKSCWSRNGLWITISFLF